jgi:hypothetical protein
MKNDASFNDAKRLYLEQYGDPMVTNTYLKIALALLSVEDDPHVPRIPASGHSN